MEGRRAECLEVGSKTGTYDGGREFVKNGTTCIEQQDSYADVCTLVVLTCFVMCVYVWVL
jgi:hypothetical protein